MCPKPLVLVVEDDPTSRDAMALVLDLGGYRAALAANGQEALDYLRGRECPGLVVLDLMMPVMDGWRFCRECRRDPRLASLPLLILSADAQLQRTAAELGAAGYLQKPADLDALLDAVRRHCGGPAGVSPPCADALLHPALAG